MGAWFSSWQTPDLHLVLHNLYLGSLQPLLYQDHSPLKDRRIRHVINFSQHTYPKLPGVEYYEPNLPDVAQSDIAAHFAKTNEIIEKALLKGQGVLVHCYMGVSRSATIILAYLMYTSTLPSSFFPLFS